MRTLAQAGGGGYKDTAPSTLRSAQALAHSATPQLQTSASRQSCRRPPSVPVTSGAMYPGVPVPNFSGPASTPAACAAQRANALAGTARV